MDEAKHLPAEQERQLEHRKDITRAAYLSAGRTAADFERDWPGMKQRRLAEPVMAEAWRDQRRSNG